MNTPFLIAKKSAAICLLAALLAPLPSASAQTAPGSSAPAPADVAAARNEEALVLTTFQVNASADKGYRAGNSVSATRVNTPIKDLPFSVSAFTSEFIADIGARELNDIVRYAPGVTAGGREFTGGNALYFIRGFSQGPQRNGFVGEAYVDASTIDRVEVVKGPASVLYGQVSPGGTVNYLIKRPGKKQSATVSLAAGNHDYHRASVDINQPLIADKLLFRFNGSVENDIEYFDNGEARTEVISPVFTYRFNDNVALTVDYQRFHRNEDAPFAVRQPSTMIVGPVLTAGVLSTTGVLQIPLTALQDPGYNPSFVGFFPLPDRFNMSGLADYRDAEFESLNTELAVKIGERWNARANFNWSKRSTKTKTTGLGQINVTVPASYFATLGVPVPTTANASYLAAARLFAADLLRDINLARNAPIAQMTRRQTGEELWGGAKASQVEFAGSHDLGGVKLKPLAGVFYNESRENFRTRTENPALNQTVWNIYDPRTWNVNTDYNRETAPLTRFDLSLRRTKAIYGVLSASLFEDRLSAVGGVRYTKSAGAVDNTFTPGASIAAQRTSATTPQAGLGWKVTRDIMVYASYSESFLSETGTLLRGTVTIGPVKPITSTGYEVGVKTDLLDGRLSSTLSAYEIEQNDRVSVFRSVDAATGVTVANTIQGTKDRSRGLEAEVTWSPLDHWQIYASGSINDIEIIEVPSQLGFLRGANPENSARVIANLWTRYTFARGPLKNLWVGGGLNHTGKKPQRPDNPALFIPAFTIFNSALGYDWKWQGRPVSATLNWTNMEDKVHYQASFQRSTPMKLVLDVTTKF